MEQFSASISVSHKQTLAVLLYKVDALRESELCHLYVRSMLFWTLAAKQSAAARRA